MKKFGTSRNVIIVGFMGTGKSTVSRLLAEKLGWESKDTDEEIEKAAGKSIKAIFAEDGEQAFRDLESNVLQVMLRRSNQVVATGGGAVLREKNRETMLKGGWVVALTADRETLLARVTSAAAAGTRPLLEGDAGERIDALLEARRHAYDFAQETVDTSARTPQELADFLFDRMPMR
ncbi:shikimate kinase [Cohnella soli]|uniref:Shikimate kinase n=1 Tax=Cohnella soli TaxID=425005 RepID=A0ABW0HPM1_9BACL